MLQGIEDESRAETLTIEIVRDLKGLESLREPWNSLFERAPNAAPPLHYDWCSTWLDIYGGRYLAGQEALRILCFRHRGELVGLLPLYLRRPQRVADGGVHLAFISTGEDLAEEICPDYMDLLCTAQERQACAARAREVICGEMGSEYDLMQLSDAADDAVLTEQFRQTGAEVDVEISPRGSCYLADLRGGMEAYIERLPQKMRGQARRNLRDAKACGAELQVASSPEQIAEFFAELMQIHQERWNSVGEQGCFASDAFASFHRRLSGEWIPQKRAVLARTRIGRQTISVKYGFLNRGKFDYYQCGDRFADNLPLKSPGIVSLLMLMSHLGEQGVQTVDFLRGSAFYKQRLATHARALVQLRRAMWTWRTGVGFVADIGVRAARKLGRTLTRRPRSRALRPVET